MTSELALGTGCIVVVFFWCLYEIRLYARRAFFGLTLAQGESPMMCPEVHSSLKGARMRALGWPFLVTVGLVAVVAGCVSIDSLRQFLEGLVPHFYVEAKEQHFADSAFVQTATLSLAIFVLMQVPSIAASSTPADEQSRLARIVSFYNSLRRWYVQDVVLRGNYNALAVALMVDLEDEWFPVIPGEDAKAQELNQARAKAMEELRELAGSPDGAKDHQVLQEALERMGFQPVVDHLRRIDKDTARKYRREVRRDCRLKVAIASDPTSEIEADIEQIGFSSWYRAKTLTIRTSDGVTLAPGSSHTARMSWCKRRGGCEVSASARPGSPLATHLDVHDTSAKALAQGYGRTRS